MAGRCTRRAAAGAARAGAAAGADGADAAGASMRRARAQAAAAARAAAARRERALARAAEVEDSPRVLRDKCRRLARAIRNAKHLVVYTGAGISTAADIPDYRGPRGVWTRLRRGEAVPRVEVSGARPTLTHMALTALWARGALRFVASQNCDGLHVRAGLPRRALAELHGNMYCERCAACRRVLLRAFDTTERTARHAHATRRLCPACGAPLHDTIVHFGERGRAAWPLNWAGALRHAAAADVILCLGSSLKVLRRYPRLWSMARPPRARPALYIVNLQWTPKDGQAALKINARCDAVMAEVCRRLRVRVPRYSARRDPLPAHASPLHHAERHTARRAHRALPPPPAQPPSPAHPHHAPASRSPSPSDSDEERPLLHLARALHRTHDAQTTPPPLTAFQVALASGAATVLLRAEHAPPAPAPAPAPASASGTGRPPSALRQFRRQRDRHNGHATSNNDSHNGATNHHCSVVKTETNGVLKDELDLVNDRLNGVVKSDVDCVGKVELDAIVKDEVCKIFKDELNSAAYKSNGAAHETQIKVRRSLQWREDEGGGEGGSEGWSSGGASEEEAAACAGAARRFTARAVLLCRAHLYPGLHTILADPPAPAPAPPAPPPPPPPAACAWCWARHGARRCLWYEPWEAKAPRVWRRAGRRRYLCTCCGDSAPDPPPAAPLAPDEPDAPDELDEPDAPGWYGKGYRKPRRRR